MGVLLKILNGYWEEGTLTLSEMPKDFVLSARHVMVLEVNEYAELQQVKEENGRLENLAIKAIQEEPECPGEMPDEMWATIKNNRSACTKIIQMAVERTKRNIIERFGQAIKEASGVARPK